MRVPSAEAGANFEEPWCRGRANIDCLSNERDSNDFPSPPYRRKSEAREKERRAGLRAGVSSISGVGCLRSHVSRWTRAILLEGASLTLRGNSH